jgi:hypothetical protein
MPSNISADDLNQIMAKWDNYDIPQEAEDKTFEQAEENLWRIRIISARKATGTEEKQYNEMTK